MGTVAILALIPGLSLAGQPAKGRADQPQGVRLTISATTERIALPALRGPLELTVDALSRRIRLVPSKKDNATAIANKLRAHVGMLCPAVMVSKGAIELGCRSRRLEAQITPEGKISYLDINELRGLPWRPGPDAPPTYHYDPWRVGLGQSCPGHSPAVRGECAFKQGEQLEAAMQFRAALETPARQLACVRLGDLAISTGDPLTAAGWYRRAGAFGVFGRIADGRLCELDGRCLGSSDEVMKAFDASGLPEPVRAEMLMRAARAEAYSGRLPAAARIIARQTREHGMTSICREGGEQLCRRLLLEAMREAGTTTVNPATLAGSKVKSSDITAEEADRLTRAYHEELLEAYLNIPAWEKGPQAVELAQAAAPLAIRLGATGFAGNLLASLAPAVPDDQLADHLLQAAETFLRGQNWARARLVADYAKSRLAGAETGKRGSGKSSGAASWKGALASPGWLAVFRRLNERAEEEEVTPAVREAIETELAATLAEIKNARDAIDNAEQLVAGARAAKAKAAADKAAAAKASAEKGAGGTGSEKSGGAASQPGAVARHEAGPDESKK